MSSIYDDPIGEIILKHEGGFVNDAVDRGGPTNLGITQKTLSQWRGYAVSIDEVRKLGEAEAREIYATRYLKRPKIDQLPFPHPQIIIFDMAVNSGPKRAIRLLQKTLNKAGFNCGKPDGAIGPNTIKATAEAWEQMGPYLQNALVEARVRFYLAIIQRDPKQNRFKRGWLRRANSFKLPVD